MSDELADHSSLIPHHSSLVLPNGVRAIVIARPETPTVSVQVHVAAGSRHDGPLFGLAHLVEHLVFRAAGGERRDLYTAVERLGGELNGGTTRCTTSFEITLGARHAAAALALLPDLVRPPALDAASFATEQDIVCHELRERASTVNQLWDLLLAALWGDHPLAHAPGGIDTAIRAAAPEQAARLFATGYGPEHVLVVICGACEEAAARAAVEQHLGGLSGAAVALDGAPPVARAGREAREVSGAVTWVGAVLGVPGAGSPAEPALRLLAAALGQGPAARLPHVLASRGVKARAQARYAAYDDAGAIALLAVGVPADREALEEALVAALDEAARVPFTPAEVAAAQRWYRGNAWRQCETNSELARAVGGDALHAHESRPLRNSVDRVLALDAAALSAAAARWLSGTPARACLVPAPER